MHNQDHRKFLSEVVKNVSTTVNTYTYPWKIKIVPTENKETDQNNDNPL